MCSYLTLRQRRSTNTLSSATGISRAGRPCACSAPSQELEERRAAEQAALQAVEVERQAKEAALAEIARLKALLERQTKG